MIREEGDDEDTCVTCGRTLEEIRAEIKNLPGNIDLARDVREKNGDTR